MLLLWVAWSNFQIFSVFEKKHRLDILVRKIITEKILLERHRAQY